MRVGRWLVRRLLRVGKRLINRLLSPREDAAGGDLEELQSLREGEGSKPELSQLQVEHTQLAEVDLRVQLLAFLIRLIVLRRVVCLLRVEA